MTLSESQFDPSLGGVVTGGADLASVAFGFEELFVAHAQPPARPASILHFEFKEFDILAPSNCVHPSLLGGGTEALIEKPNSERASIFSGTNDVVSIVSHVEIIKQKDL